MIDTILYFFSATIGVFGAVVAGFVVSISFVLLIAVLAAVFMHRTGDQVRKQAQERMNYNARRERP